MKTEKKIEILKNQIQKLRSPSFEHNRWLTETGNLMKHIFEDSDVRYHQLRNMTILPQYLFNGINVDKLIIDWEEIIKSYINEIELLSDEIVEIEIIDNGNFIDESRIKELEEIKSENFDLTKLIALCRELNSNYKVGNLLTVSMLSRAIIDHIPPIFGLNTFNEVANNYGTKSFKKNMLNLNNSLRNIADSYLHQTIRKKESLPNKTQIDFKNDLDVLLAEVIRVEK